MCKQKAIKPEFPNFYITQTNQVSLVSSRATILILRKCFPGSFLTVLLTWIFLTLRSTVCLFSTFSWCCIDTINLKELYYSNERSSFKYFTFFEARNKPNAQRKQANLDLICFPLPLVHLSENHNQLSDCLVWQIVLISTTEIFKPPRKNRVYACQDKVWLLCANKMISFKICSYVLDDRFKLILLRGIAKSTFFNHILNSYSCMPVSQTLRTYVCTYLCMWFETLRALQTLNYKYVLISFSLCMRVANDIFFWKCAVRDFCTVVHLYTYGFCNLRIFWHFEDTWRPKYLHYKP